MVIYGDDIRPEVESVQPQLEKPIEPPVATTIAELERAIAVLPFVNMSNDPDNEYFSDGMSEEILNSLVILKYPCGTRQVS